MHEPLNGLVLSLPDRREPIINDIVLMRGSYFTDRRRNEVIVNDAFARKHDFPRPVDSSDPQQPPRRAVHRRHGDLQRVRLSRRSR